MSDEEKRRWMAWLETIENACDPSSPDWVSPADALENIRAICAMARPVSP